MAAATTSGGGGGGGLSFSPAVFAKLSPHAYLLANLDPKAAAAAATSSSTVADDDDETRRTSSSSPRRTNGRAPAEARPVQVKLSSLSRAHYARCGGSALVRVGDSTAICGVRAETLAVGAVPNYQVAVVGGEGAGGGGEGGGGGGRLGAGESEAKKHDLLVPNVELATGCSPQFLPGLPPTQLAQTLSTRLYSLLHLSGLVRPEALRIYGQAEQSDDKNDNDDDHDDMEVDGPPGGTNQHREPAELKAFWVLYIDVLFISYDGNALDVAWAAAVAALRDTRLPRAWWDDAAEGVACVADYGAGPAAVAASAGGVCVPGRLPIACTAAVFGQGAVARGAGGGGGGSAVEKRRDDAGKFWVLVDPDRLEEELCDEKVTVVLDRGGGGDGGKTRILSVSKKGGTSLGAADLRAFVHVAEKRWDDFHSALEA